MSELQCPLPFVHMNIKPNQTTTACWKCLSNLGDYSKKSLTDIWHSDEWQDLRQQHLDGKKPKGCRSCWEMEEAGAWSTRQQAVVEYQDEINFINNLDNPLKPPLPSDIEIRFGNLCNLQCRHCSPKYSSQWSSLIKKSAELNTAMNELDRASNSYSINELPDFTIEELKKMASTLKMVKITGGEPLMHPMHYEMLDAFVGYEKNIILEYNTNLHYLGIGNKNVLDTWKKFKKVICRVSVDAEESTYEYMRHKGDISKVKENWKLIEESFESELKHQAFDLHATCTINALNIVKIKDTVEFFLSLGSKIHVSFVQYPKVMDASNLPDWQKNNIVLQCEQCIEFLENTPLDNLHWRFKKINYQNKVRTQSIENLKRVIQFLQKKQTLDFPREFSKWMKMQDTLNNNCLFDYYTEFDYLKDYYYA